MAVKSTRRFDLFWNGELVARCSVAPTESFTWQGRRHLRRWTLVLHDERYTVKIPVFASVRSTWEQLLDAMAMAAYDHAQLLKNPPEALPSHFNFVSMCATLLRNAYNEHPHE